MGELHSTKSWKKRLYHVFPLVRFVWRLRFGASYFAPDFKLLLRWAPKKTERDNFYYSLTPKNSRDLAASLGLVFGEPPEVFEGFFDELQSDQGLKSHLVRWQQSKPEMKDAEIGVGRRVVWYALVRHFRPRRVVETGVHHSLGALVLCAALRKNEQDGHGGSYLGTDIDPEAGSMLTGPYSELGEIRFGDSLETLVKQTEPIDFFINDSDHSHEYEKEEYQAIEKLLSPRALVLGDNSHGSESLREWSRICGRPFVFLQEKPEKHWYPGAGIGISIPRNGKK